MAAVPKDWGKEFQKAISNLESLNDKRLPKGINRVLDDNAFEAVTLAKQAAPINDGALRASIRWEVLPSKPGVYVRRVLSDRSIAPHAPYMEFGTGRKVYVPAAFEEQARLIKSEPSRRSYKQGLEAIKRWAAKKGWDESQAGRIFAYLLRNGVSPSPFLYPAFLVQRGQLLRDLEKLFRDLSRKF